MPLSPTDTLRDVCWQLRAARADCPVELALDLADQGELRAALEVLAQQLTEARTGPHPALGELAALAQALDVDAEAQTLLTALAAQVSVLSLAAGYRRGGAHQQERFYRNLLIDGQPLGGWLGDVIPVFDWMPVEVQLATLDALAGRSPGVFDDQRVPLCVCPECGDLGCGAVSTLVKVHAPWVDWLDLGWQASWGDGWSPLKRPGPDPKPPLGPFRFAHEPYLSVLDELRTGLGGRGRRR